MKEVLVVKHAVGGRTFIDTGKNKLEYTLTRIGVGWRITVKTPEDANIEELLQWRQGLNVFLKNRYEGRKFSHD